jgi:hypothetical protein
MVGVEVQLHSYLTSALYGSEGVTSRFGGFTLGKERRYSVRGLVGSRADLDVLQKRKISCPYRDSKPGPSSP